MSEQDDDLGKLRERLQNHVFSVGIMGEFKRGKSTVINALLGQEIVPADIVPCSATLNYVKWSPEKFAEVHFKDGNVKKVSVDELSGYVTKITQESERMAERVDHAVVHYPCGFCQNGVQIVDTPGLNDDERMTSISESVIPALDAIIMVLVAGSPFSQSEAEFVRNKVMASDLGRIIFVVNKIDLIDEEDRDRLMDHIRDKIRSSVLDKMAAVYGEGSDEYKNALNKMGEIKLLPVSARNALRGKTRGDKRKYEESGYLEFEEVLSKLLTEERGMLELIRPINKMQSVAAEALRTIEMRRGAMQMEAVDFERVQGQSMATIKENRKKKREEIKLLKTKGKTLYAGLLPDLEEAYGQLKEELSAYIEEVNINEADIASDTAIKELSDDISLQINQKLEDVLAIQTERLVNKIYTQLGEDVKELESLGKEMSGELEGIHTELSLVSTQVVSAGASGDGIGVGTALIDAATLFASCHAGSFIPGVGGLIAGFKSHGVKGAIVGGLSGVGLTLAATTLIGGLGIVGLPLALISGVASTFGGKTITNLIFGKKEKTQTVHVTVADIRDQLQKSVNATHAGLREERVLENWLMNACREAYEKVAEDIDREWEMTLSNMERTLTQIEADLANSKEEKERAEAELQELCGKIQEILTAVEPINGKLQGAV